ncbi:hypothetical protein Tco_0867270 [Tanacetum coccineum]
MIGEGVTSALVARDANRSTNAYDSHFSRTGVKRTERVARECTYPDFMKCQSLNFKGTEGVVELIQWFEKMETVTVGHDVAHIPVHLGQSNHCPEQPMYQRSPLVVLKKDLERIMADTVETPLAVITSLCSRVFAKMNGHILEEQICHHKLLKRLLHLLRFNIAQKSTLDSSPQRLCILYSMDHSAEHFCLWSEIPASISCSKESIHLLRLGSFIVDTFEEFYWCYFVVAGSSPDIVYYRRDLGLIKFFYLEFLTSSDTTL